MRKNIKVIGYGLWVMVALLVSAPITAQNYEAQQPNTAFQSTSTMTGSGSSYSANPSLSSDGTANAPASYAGPRRAPKPINNDDDWTDRQESVGSGLNTPLGDAVLPLLLLAAVYSVARVYRRKRRA